MILTNFTGKPITKFSIEKIKERNINLSTRSHNIRILACSGKQEIKAGARVKVVQPVIVHHVTKIAPELNLEGREGIVLQDVRQHDTVELSPNLPYKIQFEEPSTNSNKPTKFFAHLVIFLI